MCSWVTGIHCSSTAGHLRYYVLLLVASFGRNVVSSDHMVEVHKKECIEARQRIRAGIPSVQHICRFSGCRRHYVVANETRRYSSGRDWGSEDCHQRLMGASCMPRSEHRTLPLPVRGIIQVVRLCVQRCHDSRQSFRVYCQSKEIYCVSVVVI